MAQRGGNHNGPRRKARMGDWLRNHQNLPLAQQEKLLENDPNFKRLPPDRQARFKERLQKFNSLSSEERRRVLARMQFMASLTPAQRKEIRDANRKMEGLPQGRRIMIHAALRHLREMNPEERQQALQSERFRSTFTQQEQDLIRQLVAIEPRTPARASPSPAGGQQPQ